VKGGEAETLRVRTTRHGPVLSDLVPAGDALEAGHVLALAWTTLAPEDQGIQTLFGLSEATDWAGFLAAVRDHGSPQQNVHYADAAGHIGFVAPGRVPIRKAGDGRWPVPGWTGAHDWTGMIPFDALPQRLDPPSGTLFNANNRVVGEDYPYLLTADWEPAYRARRIAALLEAGGPFVLQDFAAMQADQQSLLAADILPLMLALTDEAPPSGERARVMVDALRAWDGVMAAGRPEPLIFAAWYRELARLIYQDEFGDLFSEFFAVRGPFMQRVLQTRQIWCDDVTTADIEERCAALAGRALDQALAFLDAQHGDDAGSWRWGEAHPARMAHRVLEGQPLLGDLFAIELPVGGDGSSIDVAHYRIGRSARPFTATQAASYRGLYDLADLDRSRFIAATGQSGHPLSPHFRDLALLWAAGETISMTRDPLEFGASGSRVLRLEPGSPE
jgi:penicillin amidase